MDALELSQSGRRFSGLCLCIFNFAVCGSSVKGECQRRFLLEELVFLLVLLRIKHEDIVAETIKKNSRRAAVIPLYYRRFIYNMRPAYC